MNFLGHFYLSKHKPGLLVGNYIADFVKGKKYLDYPEEISKGIVMHRNIDHFTDHHPMIRKGKKRLFPIYRHYSSVIMDMYYDHFLARNWHTYSNESLGNFSESVYAIIEQHWEFLPQKSQFMFPYMKSGDWLRKYATTEGIGASLNGMSRRLNNNSKLELALDQLHEFYEHFKAEFELFMPDLKKHFKNYRT
jgi:acyl carrier protein phosphodiesterase